MDLSLVATDELIEALRARYDAFIFGGYERLTASKALDRWRMVGERMLVRGLGFTLLEKLIQEDLGLDEDTHTLLCETEDEDGDD